MSAASHEFTGRLDSIAVDVERSMRDLLADSTAAPARLLAAMRHGALGGKRIRPFLVIESAALFGFERTAALPVAVAFECLHCYSLVHDDLPAMDDDPLRRGQPTVHVAFDEATAILAGDALLTIAFEALARAPLDPECRVDLIALLARAGGAAGMAGGQMLDLEAEGRFSPGKRPPALAVADVERLQAMKTGALLAACCQAGARIGCAGEAARSALGTYARALGLAFQIADDLLDAEGDPAELGKAVRKDAQRNKASLVSLLGPAAARMRLAGLVQEAEAALAPFGEQAAMLRACARYVAERKR